MTWLMLASVAHGQPEAGKTFFRPMPDDAFLGRISTARSTAIGDVDNDGWADVVVADNGDKRWMTVWRNEAGRRFSPGLKLRMPVATGAGTILGDYDNDGDLDIFVATGSLFESVASRNPLLRNDQGVFTDIGVAAGLEAELPTDNAIWLDFDADGWLDIYTGNVGWSPDRPWLRNRLFRNRGDGTFEDVTLQVGLDVQLSGWGGGSNGGMAAADFNGDGRIDLYLGVWGDANRLFLQQANGTFADRSTGDIADPGLAFGVAVGDFTGDGMPDIVQAAGGLPNTSWSVPVLYNLGGGVFVNVLESSGLGSLSSVNIGGVGLGDVDNDGDLDLLVAGPHHFLFSNDGAGVFTDATSVSGIPAESRTGVTVCFGDLNNDGFLDVVSGGLGQRWLGFLNNGNANHYLRVQLEGLRSNRQGIGARVVARAGDLRQTREVLGGRGWSQDEAVAHFGLGPRTRVDQLKIRWPSGQVDVVEDIPADQKIRVFEGRGGYHRVVPSEWVMAPPEEMAVDSQASVPLAVRPALLEAEAQVRSVSADLSAFGGPDALPLEPRQDGTWAADGLLLAPVGHNGYRELSVMIDQHSSLGPQWARLSRSVTILPDEDLVVFGDALDPQWRLEADTKRVAADPEERSVVFSGQTSMALRTSSLPTVWTVKFVPGEPVELVGYQRLRFSFHPGDSTSPTTASLFVFVNTVRIALLGEGQRLASIDMAKKDWQVVEIPLDSVQNRTPLESERESIAALEFQSTLGGTVYLDDIRLVARPLAPVTAVVEERSEALPGAFALDQNHPNPFNSSTVIPFAVPRTGVVELAVYDLLGQRVSTLASGRREGGRYQLRWDGRDDTGRELASGVYLCRMTAGERVESRKLLLLR